MKTAEILSPEIAMTLGIMSAGLSRGKILGDTWHSYFKWSSISIDALQVLVGEHPLDLNVSRFSNAYRINKVLSLLDEL